MFLEIITILFLLVVPFSIALQDRVPGDKNIDHDLKKR